MEQTPVTGAWQAFSSEERELFFAAIARHRRASWRVTAACAVAVTALALVVAVLMSPLLYALIGLGFDLLNFVTPAPDVMGALGRLADRIVNGRNVPPGLVVRAIVLAPLPGAALLLGTTYALRRIWLTSPLFDGGSVPGRTPDPTVLGELRLANVVEEMAIAAGTPVPRIVIVPGGVNAAACGRDAAHVTLLVGEAMPAAMDRAQLEGMVAHLVGSIADGDMTIGLRVTTTLALFGLLARVGTAFGDRRRFWETAKLWRVFVAPTSSGTAALLGALADPFHDTAPRDSSSTRPAQQSSDLTWRDWLMMPLMGPLLLTGFLAGFVTEFFLEPLVALAWRQRKYMADATAVQLTRDPDGLASAIGAIVDRPRGIVPWTAHLAVAADPRGQSGPFGKSLVPIFPSPDKRVEALARMGAHVRPSTRKGLPLIAAVVIGTLGVIVATLMAVVVYLLVIVSAMLSMLFTLMPAALLHVILRYMAR